MDDEWGLDDQEWADWLHRERIRFALCGFDSFVAAIEREFGVDIAELRATLAMFPEDRI